MKVSSVEVQAQSQVKTNRARLGDLIWIFALGVLLVGVVLLAEVIPGWAAYLAPLRIPLGIVYVLFAPGYLLQAALFPRKDDLDGVERLGLSLGLSVGLIPLLALLLDRLPWGLHLWPVVIGQGLLVVMLFTVAMLLRLLIPVEEVYSPDLHLKPRAWWTSLDPSNRRLLAFTGIAVLIAGLITAWIFLVPSKAEFMTEFYMLGKEGLAEDYPREVMVGEAITITMGITNREGNTSTYSIKVLLDNQMIKQTGPITLENQITWEGRMEFALPEAGDDQQVLFILDREGQDSPYRTLKLWLNVQPADVP